MDFPSDPAELSALLQRKENELKELVKYVRKLRLKNSENLEKKQMEEKQALWELQRIEAEGAPQRFEHYQNILVTYEDAYWEKLTTGNLTYSINDYKYQQHSPLDFGGSVELIKSSTFSIYCAQRGRYSSLSYKDIFDNVKPARLADCFQKRFNVALAQGCLFLLYFVCPFAREIVKDEPNFLSQLTIFTTKIYIQMKKNDTYDTEITHFLTDVGLGDIVS